MESKDGFSQGRVDQDFEASGNVVPKLRARRFAFRAVVRVRLAGKGYIDKDYSVSRQKV